MTFSRLIQPRNPLFWIMLGLNVLSLVLATIAQTFELNMFGKTLVYGFAFCNAVLGLWLAARLAGSTPEKR